MGLLDPPGKRNFTYVVAASDSSAGGADYRCTGSGDQTVINAAIAACGSRGGKILLRAGNYSLSGSIVVDRDCITLEGENRPHWGQSVDTEGTRATKLKAAAGGFDTLTISTANAGAESRLRGLAFRNLYVYGNSKSGYGIKDLTHTDVSEISDCFFHECAAGIYVAWDSPIISRNNVQYCSSGIRVSYHYGMLSQNIVYDCTTWGIQLEGQGPALSGNTIGQCTTGIWLNATQGASIAGNTISVAKGTASGILLDQGGKWNTITGNTVGIHGVITNQNVANVTGDGIQIGASGSACVDNTISGNTVIAQASTAGYAIAIRNSSTRNTITGNTTAAPTTWNSASASTTILVGTGNTVANNGGHT